VIFSVLVLLVAACGGDSGNGGDGGDPTTATTAPPAGSQPTTPTTASPGPTAPPGGGPTPTLPEGQLARAKWVVEVQASNGGLIFVSVECDEPARDETGRQMGQIPHDGLMVSATGFEFSERFTAEVQPSIDHPLMGIVGPEGFGAASAGVHLSANEYQVSIDIIGETITATITGCGE